MYPSRLRRMISFVEKCKKGMCPIYLNDLFEINSGSSSRRLSMLKQPKYNSRHGSNSLRYQGAKLWNAVDNSFKAASNYDSWYKECSCSSCDICVLKALWYFMAFHILWQSVIVYASLCMSYFTHTVSSFVHISSPSSSCRRIAYWLMFTFALYSTLNKILLTYILLTYIYGLPQALLTEQTFSSTAKKFSVEKKVKDQTAFCGSRKAR